jgi:hypothetical protein
MSLPTGEWTGATRSLCASVVQGNKLQRRRESERSTPCPAGNGPITQRRSPCGRPRAPTRERSYGDPASHQTERCTPCPAETASAGTSGTTDDHGAGIASVGATGRSPLQAPGGRGNTCARQCGRLRGTACPDPIHDVKERLTHRRPRSTAGRRPTISYRIIFRNGKDRVAVRLRRRPSAGHGVDGAWARANRWSAVSPG